MRYVLAQRRTFLADEQGLGKTIEAIAALQADGAFPAAVVCPASMKLVWERECARWLPGRSVAVLHGRGAQGWVSSGAGLGRRFRGAQALDRLHWNLRAHCYVRRTKADVLPQLPAKRFASVPVELDNTAEYRLAEQDVIAWLRTQPLDLRALEARVAAALRAEQLARLNYLRRLAARGKLRAALAWIEDFTASGEPLVVFAHHREVQRALIERFPAAAHVLGDDDLAARAAAVDDFQRPDGPPLVVCSMQAASQGITLVRASNVAFVELDWTPARHDQAEDRCHRIGQRDAVTAYYLLASETIDEQMASVLQRKRAIIDAVTDGQRSADTSALDAVVRALRERPAGAALRAAA